MQKMPETIKRKAEKNNPLVLTKKTFWGTLYEYNFLRQDE
jgi:hypothetical protein